MEVVHLWQEYHTDDAVFFSLQPIRWYMISIGHMIDALYFDHLAQVVCARLLHCEVTHFPFVIKKYVDVGRVTLRPCKYPIPHQI